MLSLERQAGPVFANLTPAQAASYIFLVVAKQLPPSAKELVKGILDTASAAKPATPPPNEAIRLAREAALVARHFALAGWPLHHANLWLVAVAAVVMLAAYAAADANVARLREMQSFRCPEGL